MITSVHIENFKCFKDFDIDLGSFNVLIGPNDSGKTAFLQALMIGTYQATGQWGLTGLARAIGMPIGPANFWRKNTDSPIRIGLRGKEWGDDQAVGRPHLDVASEGDRSFRSSVEGAENARPGWNTLMPKGVNWREDWYQKTIGKAEYFAFDPSNLRKASRQTEEMFRMTCAGEHLATFLDDMLRQDRDVFSALEKEFYSRFPDYSLLTIDKVKHEGVVAYVVNFRTQYDHVLPAGAVSDGVMLSLAYLALCYRPDPPKVLLIEEPEAGVHHASLKQIVTTLRELSDQKHVQIVLTTHSPYLLDCVEPEEVRVFAKDDEGAVHATKLSDHPDVERMKKHFMSGEIWTGLSEEDIVLNPGTDK